MRPRRPIDKDDSENFDKEDYLHDLENHVEEISNRSKLRESAQEYFDKGNYFYHKNDFVTAISHYSKAIELDPKHFAALLNRALTYQLLNQFDKALYDFNILKKLDPKNDYVKLQLDKINSDFLSTKFRINKPNFFQQWLGMNNTFTWQNKASEIRKKAWSQLIILLRQENDKDAKLAIIHYAESLPVFNDHRSNYEITRDSPSTFAVKMLHELKMEIEGTKQENLITPGKLNLRPRL